MPSNSWTSSALFDIVMQRIPRPRLLVAAFLLFLPCLLFHRALFLGDAFLPGDTLKHLAPWKTNEAPAEPWNVLRFDGITQFYPWRLQMVRSWRSGHIPVTNPYAFAADGGTPLLANSQSAPFYPPNLLFVALGEERLWYGFGLSAALHLLIAAVGIYRFARVLGLSRSGGLLAAITFSLSGPILCWLSLPTFLCASAWLPWLLLSVHRAHLPGGRRAGVLAGVFGGLTLLAGHLQIALYVLLTGGVYALVLGRKHKISPVRWIGSAVGIGVAAVCLSLPQVLPAVALSRQSHRAATHRPTYDDFQRWRIDALPPQTVLTLTVPDFYGHPNRNGGTYWNTSWRADGNPNPNNFAEWTAYVGILPLLLAFLGAGRLRFFAGLALLTLLMAYGTWANLPFFFLVPGWAQTGNPGRILVVFTFAIALLAGAGHDQLVTSGKRPRVLALTVVIFSLVGSLPLAQGHAARLQLSWPEVFGAAQFGLMMAVLWLVLGAAVLFAAPKWPLARPLALVITLADLAFWGAGYNPTCRPADIYPVTPGIAWLQEHANGALIAPINDRWSNGWVPARNAALVPNALTVYRLYDLGGYDSLFRATAKQRIADATGGEPCPPENGNMVFIKTPEAAVALGAKYIVTAPDRALATTLALVYDGPDLKIYENPAGQLAPPADPTVPSELIQGLIAMGLSLLSLGGFALAGRRRSLSPPPPLS